MMDETGHDPRLRYVDVGDLDESAIEFGGLDVINQTGEKIGEVDGFVVDIANDRTVVHRLELRL